MAQLMWKIPASADFVKYVAVAGFTDKLPIFEHKYLGHQLTAKGSLAQKVSVDENEVRIMYNVIVEGRKFNYEFSTNTWFVPADK